MAYILRDSYNGNRTLAAGALGGVIGGITGALTKVPVPVGEKVVREEVFGEFIDTYANSTVSGGGKSLKGSLWGKNQSNSSFINTLDEPLVVSASAKVKLPASVLSLIHKNISNNGKAVIGHFDEFVNKAERVNASYFDIGDAYYQLSPAQQWEANKRFLDIISNNNNQVYLSISKSQIRAGSILLKEINYLRVKGYRWLNQWSLVKP